MIGSDGDNAAKVRVFNIDPDTRYIGTFLSDNSVPDRHQEREREIESCQILSFWADHEQYIGPFRVIFSLRIFCVCTSHLFIVYISYIYDIDPDNNCRNLSSCYTEIFLCVFAPCVVCNRHLFVLAFAFPILMNSHNCIFITSITTLERDWERKID